MKNSLFLILYTLLFISACSEDSSSDLDKLLIDRVWISSLNQNQYYFSSKDNREYLWMKFERRDGKTYTPFSEAKGTPETNLLELAYDNTYREGWSASDYFKVIGDTIIFQEEDDINAENISKFHIEPGPDTTIGVFDYKTLKVSNFAGTRIWRTKK